jgi:predicted PP-loop superfamily ATPase
LPAVESHAELAEVMGETKQLVASSVAVLQGGILDGLAQSCGL